MLELDYLENFIKMASRIDKAKYYEDHVVALIKICKEQEEIINTYNTSQDKLKEAQNIITAAEKISEVLEKHGLYVNICTAV